MRLPVLMTTKPPFRLVHPVGVSVIALLVGALAPACSYDWEVGATKTDGGTSDSGGGGVSHRCALGASGCDFSCTIGAPCSTLCEGGSSCKSSCTRGKCTFVCGTGASCDFSCTGGGCVTECGLGSVCKTSCTGGGCEFRCSVSGCDSSCLGGNCTTTQL